MDSTHADGDAAGALILSRTYSSFLNASGAGQKTEPEVVATERRLKAAFEAADSPKAALALAKLEELPFCNWPLDRNKGTAFLVSWP